MRNLKTWKKYEMWEGDAATGHFKTGKCDTYEGTVAPWFGCEGQGSQITIPITVEALIDLGLVKRIK